MLQRAALCVALACQPKLLIADEPTTALDATVQAEILQLLARLKRELGMAMLLITHDFGVAAQLADTIAVMRAGKFVEQGRAEEVLYTPAHPYTWSLLAALPGAENLPQKGAAEPGQAVRSGPRGDCAASLAGAPLEKVSDPFVQSNAIESPGRAQASLEHSPAPGATSGQEGTLPNRAPLTAHAAQKSQNAAQFFPSAPEEKQSAPEGPRHPLFWLGMGIPHLWRMLPRPKRAPRRSPSPTKSLRKTPRPASLCPKTSAVTSRSQRKPGQRPAPQPQTALRPGFISAKLTGRPSGSPSVRPSMSGREKSW